VTDSTFVQDISSSLRNRTLAVFDLKKSESQDRYIVPSPNKQEPRASVLSALLAAIEERHRHRNWDGEDAEPITDETLSLTRTFLLRVEALIAGRSVRPDVELDVVPEPNGDIAVDWFIDHEHNVGISVSNDSLGGVYYFAWRYDGERRTGKTKASSGIPAELAQLILCFYR
jgi:hypothetical protein